MPEYHCVMTIQSVWNRDPRAAVTCTAVLSASTAQELYDLMHVATMERWHVEHHGTTMGKPVVLHWSFTKNTLG